VIEIYLALSCVLPEPVATVL